MRCFDALGLPDTATVEAIRKRWYELAAVHHPDKGGDAARFAELHEAYERATKIAEEAALVCQTCGGSGSVPRTSGFSVVLIACPGCRLETKR